MRPRAAADLRQAHDQGSFGALPGERPPLRALERSLENRLRELFVGYGYEPIDTPILEPTELFLRKSGEAIASRMYSFTLWNRDLCLRPEFTASVIRAYVNHMQDRPLPLRVQYAGPTFRYERAQQERHHQFTEVGAECIGAAGPPADAEILALARDGLEVLGIRKARFVVGHLGAVLGLLGQIGMDSRAQALVVAEMERLAQSPAAVDAVVDRLTSMLAGRPEKEPEADVALGEMLQSLGTDAASAITADLLERANLSPDGGMRPPQEIVERLLRKARRPSPAPDLRRASVFVGKLRELAGPPEQALPALRRLLAEQGLDDAPVREVELALEHFNAYFDSPAEVVVDLSLARGLRYYTGLIFEIYVDQEEYLGGGGRYDDLVRSLGGRSAVPACGFSFWLEQLIAARQREFGPDAAAETVEVLLVPVESEDYDRRNGLSVELDVKFRGVKNNLQHANRQRIPFVVIVGERERATGAATLHDMRAFTEISVAQTELQDVIRKQSSARGTDPGTGFSNWTPEAGPSRD
ncbi:MAG: histidine--tRNA ligase family protein [Betaproteobacteria bacterium]|nr:histidine--tRNA ligase family protein [Betaproteobacteria bacterium]